MSTKLKDIAAELNLSVSTISRVINGRDRVDPDTRARVQQALSDKAFKPNEVARSLRLNRVNTIVVIVPDVANNFYASIIKGAQEMCRNSGYSLMVVNSDENADFEREVLQELPKHQISGLILASVRDSLDLSAKSSGALKPVFIDNLPSFEDRYDSVAIDNVEAARFLTNKMIERGYKKIAFITGMLTQSSGADRLKGYRTAIAKSCLKIDEDLIVYGDFKLQSGYLGMKKLLSRKEPEAVIVSNNFMSYGAIRAIRERNLIIPDNIAIAAFDIIDESELMSPKITAINQPASEIGRKAAQILIERLSGAKLGYSINILLEPFFASGDSW